MQPNLLERGDACDPTRTFADGHHVIDDAVRAAFCDDLYTKIYAGETALRLLGNRAAEVGRELVRGALAAPSWGGTCLVFTDESLEPRGARGGSCNSCNCCGNAASSEEVARG